MSKRPMWWELYSLPNLRGVGCAHTKVGWAGVTLFMAYLKWVNPLDGIYLIILARLHH